MKIVINGYYGGFYVPENFWQQCKIDHNYFESQREIRTNAKFIDWVEDNEDNCEDLEVVEIPDTATDWEIIEYDGAETLIYVVDGKIQYA